MSQQEEMGAVEIAKNTLLNWGGASKHGFL